MSIQVTGILVDPIGTAMETSLRITALDSNISVQGAHATVDTAVDGTYNFTLEEGVFLVQLLQAKEFTEGVTILVDNLTPTVITIGSLLDNHIGSI